MKLHLKKKPEELYSDKSRKIAIQRFAVFFIIGGIFLLLPIIFWVVQFHGLPYSSIPEDWAFFATYFAGFLGTILSLLNLGVIIYLATVIRTIQKQEDNSAKKYYTLTELHKEWNGEQIYRSRDIAFTYLLKNPQIDLKLIGESADRPDELAHVWIIQGFFERLQALILYEMVQKEIAVQLFGQIFIWWDEFLFKEKIPKEWPNSERIDYLRNIIVEQVDRETLEKWKVYADTYKKRK
jgi:hypothetical protein